MATGRLLVSDRRRRVVSCFARGAAIASWLSLFASCSPPPVSPSDAPRHVRSAQSAPDAHTPSPTSIRERRRDTAISPEERAVELAFAKRLMETMLRRPAQRPRTKAQLLGAIGQLKPGLLACIREGVARHPQRASAQLRFELELTISKAGSATGVSTLLHEDKLDIRRCCEGVLMGLHGLPLADEDFSLTFPVIFSGQEAASAP